MPYYEDPLKCVTVLKNYLFYLAPAGTDLSDDTLSAEIQTARLELAEMEESTTLAAKMRDKAYELRDTNFDFATDVLALSCYVHTIEKRERLPLGQFRNMGIEAIAKGDRHRAMAYRILEDFEMLVTPVN
jgi:hypothetical protein